MFQSVFKYQRLISFLFLMLFYAELFLVPAIVRANYYNRDIYLGLPLPAPTQYTTSNTTFFNDGLPEESAVSMIEAEEQPERINFGGGPTQPEMQSFSSVNSDNMVDLFTGDFSYTIPLLDVGGYPITLGYKGGVSMEQEASWVGLGWNVNPGSITRNMRGLPDDFTGDADSIRKVMKIAPNKTTGATVGGNLEIGGGERLGAGIGLSLGIFKNTYKGWGIESGLNASIRVGSPSKGALTSGLSFANNSQSGLTVSPSFAVNITSQDAAEKGGYGGTFSVSSPYNARTGIRVLQLSAGLTQYKQRNESKKAARFGSTYGTHISFASPTFIPSINLPYTSRNISFTGKLGWEAKVFHPSIFVSGYQSVQYIDDADTVLRLPAFGYLNYHKANDNNSALLDFNREKEIPYREKPAVPHIALPFYTPDVFSISGEGSGGNFRAYRGDIGWVKDHYMRTKDRSEALSVDIGLGDLVHAGVDLNVNRAITQTGGWENENAAKNSFRFRRDSLHFQASYFKNPGEKTIIDKHFYDAVGGDDLVSVGLFQPGSSSSLIQVSNKLNRYKNRQLVSTQPLVAEDLVRNTRDKRTQVISYLTAGEAEAAGLQHLIESYVPDSFNIAACYADLFPLEPETGVGLTGIVYANKNLEGPSTPHFRNIWDDKFKDKTPFYSPIPPYERLRDHFSIRWIARLRAPLTGRYIIKTRTDDGIRMWINDSLRINNWKNQAAKDNFTTVYLTAGEFYNIRMEYYEYRKEALISFKWNKPGDAVNVYTPIPKEVFYDLEQKTLYYPNVIKEKRVNDYRKSSHLSEITVLNNDGRRYVYGIPVYNLKQVETSFSIPKHWGNTESGMAYYTQQAASVENDVGRDKYFTKEEMPAYAHSFLLTGLLSPDYVDVTGDGITDDDLGDAIKFNYSRIAGIQDPFRWRAPGGIDSVSYNEGLKTDSRDDKGSMVYGDKELWYMHSIVSKTMIATFHLENRTDVRSVDQTGRTTMGKAKRLKEIRLYSKAEFLQQSTKAIPIKTVHFEYSYDLCPGVNQGSESGKLTLKSVYFTYKGNAKGKRNKYQFSYSGVNPRFHPRSMDRWGEYKDPATNPGSNGSTIVPNSEYPYSIQDSTLAAQNASAWALDSIFLPSGGSMKIKYESDDYAYVQHKRAMQLFKIAGFGHSGNATPTDKLYSLRGDHLYVFVDYSGSIANTTELYNSFLAGIDKLLLRVAVKVPGDQFGSGYEYITCYADMANGAYYGLVNTNRFWIKLKGISREGDSEGLFSPVVKAATQFLRLNLGSKAFPGSENDGNLGVKETVGMLATQGENIKEASIGYEWNIRSRYQMSEAELDRSFIRLLNPIYRKFGGGHRVKSIKVYDNWDKMTQQRSMVYGQEYDYSQVDTIKGKVIRKSNGVASFEPGIGGEENPFRMPLEYVEKTGILGPVTLGYTETPLGESIYPAPSIGYSKVRVRSLHYKNVKSASGLSETEFYTAYDFPVYTEHSLLDNDTKKRYRPALSNFLRINAKHFIGLSQGFKVELNDMHGKIKSQSSYAETDLNSPITSTRYIYKTENLGAGHKRLANTVMAIRPDGTIDTSALIGKDVELMVDMREQLSISNGNNINLNADIFNVPPPPFIFAVPSVISMPQREENKYRSVAVTKVIQRYGILDSVIHSDKGSIVSTKDLLYDAETGDVLLTRTKNSFRDPVYTFNYPSHWAYEGMGLAYKNIDVILRGLEIRDGKIISGLTGEAGQWLFPGDEVLANGSIKTGTINDCEDQPATFGKYSRLWIVDAAGLGEETQQLYLIDEAGQPYTGYNVSLKVIRSGRRNQLGAVGSIAMKENPIVINPVSNLVELEISDTRNVIQAEASELSEVWQVNNSFKRYNTIVPGTTCPDGYTFIDSLRKCIRDTVPIYSAPVSICVMNAPYVNYSSCGAAIYSEFDAEFTHFKRDHLNSSNLFWKSENPNLCVDQIPKVKLSGAPPISMMALMEGPVYDSSGFQHLEGKMTPMAAIDDHCSPSTAPRIGPLNRSAIWVCCDSVLIDETWWGFTRPITVPETGAYYIGFGADNEIRISLNGQKIAEWTGGVLQHFTIWHIIPVYLTQGTHQLKIEGRNISGVKGLGVEVYASDLDELRNASDTTPPNILFSTAQLINESIPSEASCPFDYTLIEEDAVLKCRKTLPVVDSFVSSGCISLLERNLNPYTSGLLGNWRAKKSYVYYGDRRESNPATETNIRQDGIIADFESFWKFEDGKLVASADTNRWVWNMVATKYNNRGLELENFDPLGRYNAGIYGYKHTLPVAVVNNSRYQEAMFEGFEDYGFSTQNCDTACVVPRHIDFGNYTSQLDTVYSHSGRYSIRVGGETNSIAITVPVVASSSNTDPAFSLLTKEHGCSAIGTVLDKIQTDSSALLPSYRPRAGQRMVISAWVKESEICTNGTYENNQIYVVDNGGSSYTLQPKGSIIEGWQRYEAVIDIHASASQLTIQLSALNGATVYFDDLRMHPYHANMKSFVYDATDLRLMAELDENNYATFYEYDDEGTLVRLKKETIRGIQTIKETRSALQKN